MAMLDMRLETKQAALAIEDVELDGSFSGYASVFGLPDLGNDVIERGAFARSLAKGGVSGVRMLWQHDAAEPIGVWTAIREDARGLYVEGRLAKGVARARDALELMRGGGLDGLSIGFRTVKARKDARTGLRHIIEADLWEISVVPFPEAAAGAGQQRQGGTADDPRIRTLAHAGCGAEPNCRENRYSQGLCGARR